MSKKRVSEIEEALLFIEELSWVLESRKKFDLKKMVKFLREFVNQQNAYESIVQDKVFPNTNKLFLIGVLPRLFQDTKLFPNNESISDFATQVLKIEVTRFEKRSKYELIGLIVCETESLNDSKLSQLVEALEQISGSEEKLNRIRESSKESGFSWNLTIQQLTSSSNE